MRPRVGIVSTYLPSRCGLASFAAGLRTGLLAAGAATVEVAAVVREPEPRPAPEVAIQVRRDRPADYRRAAARLNRTADVVLVQHEYGIFGGADGELVLELLAALRAPAVVTLHTVLSRPSPGQMRVVQLLARRAAALVTIARRGARVLADVYGVAPRRVAWIPHGVPRPPAGSPAWWKERFGLSGRTVVLTFGLIGPGKGLEVALEALARSVPRVPDLLYVIAGATHPEVLRREGEAYRHELEGRVRRLGLADHVRWINRYLEEDDLLGLLLAADVYVTPYLGREQMSSGTLTFAAALGKAVVSTPYPYADELLGGGAGVLVGFEDAEALAAALVELGRSPERRAELGERARARAGAWTWPAVAGRYLRLARRLLSRRLPLAAGGAGGVVAGAGR